MTSVAIAHRAMRKQAKKNFSEIDASTECNPRRNAGAQTARVLRAKKRACCAQKKMPGRAGHLILF
ncbi:MAG: hypothetical protein HZA66_01935 [Rhodopseudomonas palustris]|uniref:Uncharacterized protein n=1 Tax=Rhodopseudomonas palustris TaxID=1076 RepID=A0A933VT04_RHOPL|nr:hypothetical protein [Rhodopseudomonas palustris]